MKTHAKRLIAALTALLFTALAAGCAGLAFPLPGGNTNAPETPPAAQTPGPASPETPSGPEGDASQEFLTEASGVTILEKTVLYPEDAAEAEADFRLDYALPAFDERFPAAAAMNEQVALYEDELLERVREERLPFADAAAGGAQAHTRVECRVARAGGYVNVYLYEYTSFGGAQEALPRILVLGPDGARASLASATGVYDVEPLAAQQVFNLIDANRSAYFGDLTLDDIPIALDLYAGFFVTDEGYGLAAAPGTLAPEEEGILVFLIDREAFYPQVVGNVLSIEEYEAVRGPLDALAAACAQDYAGFSDSSPGAFAATAFLTRLMTTGAEEGPFVSIPQAEYERAYETYFSGPFPADFAEAGDGTFLEGGHYMLPVHPRSPWALRIDRAVRTEAGLILYGMIFYGVPGTSAAGELAAATVTLIKNGASPTGYRFESLELR